jgi:hypothetical protein
MLLLTVVEMMMQVLEALKLISVARKSFVFRDFEFYSCRLIETAINASFAKSFRDSFTFGPMLLISGVVKLRCHF